MVCPRELARSRVSSFEFPFCPVKRSLSNPDRIPFRTHEWTGCDRHAILIRRVAPPHLLRHVHVFVDRTRSRKEGKKRETSPEEKEEEGQTGVGRGWW